jgi:hypothetical protein
MVFKSDAAAEEPVTVMLAALAKLLALIFARFSAESE